MTQALELIFSAGIAVGIFIGGLSMYVFAAWCQRKDSVPNDRS
jgi:hypothetical protein